MVKNLLIAFGVRVFYLPTFEHEVDARQKAGPSMSEGSVLAGYNLNLGGRLYGEYLVFDAQAFRDKRGPVYQDTHDERGAPFQAIS